MDRIYLIHTPQKIIQSRRYLKTAHLFQNERFIQRYPASKNKPNPLKNRMYRF